MPLEKVAENIRAQGEAEAKRIVEEAEQEAQRIRDAAEDEANEVREARQQELEEHVESLRRQELASARLTAKKRRLDARREVMSEAREALTQRVRNLPKAERERHIQALVEQANVPDGRVYVAEQDEDVAQDLGLDIAGTFEGIGGVLVEAPDGAYTENLRYGTLLDRVWEGNLHDVAEVLFDGKLEE